MVTPPTEIPEKAIAKTIDCGTPGASIVRAIATIANATPNTTIPAMSSVEYFSVFPDLETVSLGREIADTETPEF
ncbi:Uncharacterised protein [Chlamydia trachomatis]|nr:Uncharacterised protein [Chlamydia trachomatis]